MSTVEDLILRSEDERISSLDEQTGVHGIEASNIN